MKIVLTIAFVLVFVFAGRAESGPFMFVFLTTNPNKPDLPKEKVDSIMKGHLSNIERLAAEGKIIAAGPFYDGGGIFVMATASRDTAWEWLKTDPGVRADRWNIELLPYAPRIGSVCRVGEDYEMVGYGFVRYSLTEKPSRENGILMSDHLEYVASVVPRDSIVAEGVFEGGVGAILITRGEPDELALKREPVVKQGKLEMIVRKLWIARGSFCE